jgi:hypothetical protein
MLWHIIEKHVVREKDGLFGIRWGSFSLADYGNVCVNLSGFDNVPSDRAVLFVTNYVVNCTVTRSESCYVHCRFIVLIFCSLLKIVTRIVGSNPAVGIDVCLL